MSRFVTNVPIIGFSGVVCLHESSFSVRVWSHGYSMYSHTFRLQVFTLFGNGQDCNKCVYGNSFVSILSGMPYCSEVIDMNNQHQL